MIENNNLLMYRQVLQMDCQDCGIFDDCIFYHNMWLCVDCYIESVDVEIKLGGNHAKENPRLCN